jgi:hypothetical protein
VLVWRLFLDKLPSKDNLSKRGVYLNSYVLCLGGWGTIETINHSFFSCPILSVVWSETVNWLGGPVAFVGDGYAHLKFFKGLVSGNRNIIESLGVIWYSNVSTVWKDRNDMTFNQVGFNWEKVVEEAKILSWSILTSRTKGFNYSLTEWLLIVQSSV